MSALTSADRRYLEAFLGMGSGYVLNFTNSTFGDIVLEFTGRDIYDDKYRGEGDSKAKRLRAFWKLEADYIVGKLLKSLIDYETSFNQDQSDEWQELAGQCREIAERLLARSRQLEPLKAHAVTFNANHLNEQIRRMEEAIETDPALAIGTAKELIETCCKTILAERNVVVDDKSDIPQLTKATLKELRLVPDGVPGAAQGSDVVKRLLSNLGSMGHGLAELRNLYGTGHGKPGHSLGLDTRHARLAVGVSATLVTFLFETHIELGVES